MKYPIIQTIGLIGLFAFCLPSCSGESPVDEGIREELVVSAEILSSAANSKAGETNGLDGYDKRAFVTDDVIKISKNGVTDVANYTCSGTRWLPSDKSLTVDGSTLQTFTAIYPHDFTAILEDQTDNGANTGANFKKSNQLKSEKEVTGNYVKFAFAPAFSKITITVVYASATQNVTATLTGKSTESGTNGGIRTGGTTSETISLLRTSSNESAIKAHVFTGILFSGTREFVLKVEETGSSGETATKKYTQAVKAFASGYNYIYNFSASDNLILNSVKVTPFGTEETTDMGSAT